MGCYKIDIKLFSLLALFSLSACSVEDLFSAKQDSLSKVEQKEDETTQLGLSQNTPQVGAWAGSDIKLDMYDNSGRYLLGCAHGSFENLVATENGWFARGVHYLDSPVDRVDENGNPINSEPISAHYFFEINDQGGLHMSIDLVNFERPNLEFDLIFGAELDLVVCP